MKNIAKARRNAKGVTTQPLGLRLAPEEVAEVEAFAEEQERSRAWFLRFLVLRGLADYKREIESKTTN